MLCSSVRGRPFLPIATERLILRPLEPQDAPALAILANDKRVAECLATLPHPYSLKDAEKFIARVREGLTSGKFIHLAIVHREKGDLMGVIGYEDTLGYWVAPEFWGQRYVKEAAETFVSVLFYLTNLDKIEGSALQDNVASCRIFEGLGFTKTGTRECRSLGYDGVKPGFTYVLSREDFYKRALPPSFPKVWAAALFMVNEDQQVLVAERLSHKPLTGVWEMPGGKIEAGESPEEAIVREIKEELDITVEFGDFKPLTFVSYPYETFQVIVLCYICRKWKGTPRGAEGQNILWAGYDKLVTLPFLPPVPKVIHQVLESQE